MESEGDAERLHGDVAAHAAAQRHARCAVRGAPDHLDPVEGIPPHRTTAVAAERDVQRTHVDAGPDQPLDDLELVRRGPGRSRAGCRSCAGASGARCRTRASSPRPSPAHAAATFGSARWVSLSSPGMKACVMSQSVVPRSHRHEVGLRIELGEHVAGRIRRRTIPTSAPPKTQPKTRELVAKLVIVRPVGLPAARTRLAGLRVRHAAPTFAHTRGRHTSENY